MADTANQQEEQFVLRVQDEALAGKLRKVLQDKHKVEGFVELTFQGAQQPWLA